MTSERDGHVRVLPLHVANKIAAGEVVERPASVVKELVENAIDAGAKRVSVSVVQGGRKLVSVQDDGCGMSRDDATLSLERQATSKIRDVEDIDSIDTLGFRGEAIPSIASVSRFTMVTRRAVDDEGTEITVNAGVLSGVSSAGCPPGTRVEVRDLFCNVPARRRFLRAYATEEGHIRSVFATHALAHPSIGFTLTSDGREIYRLAPAGSISDRVRDLFGEDFLESLLKASGESGSVKVSGFLERPGRATPSRHGQYVFVNGRPAGAACISAALRDAYPRQPGDFRPAAILFIDMPPSGVDVNVHPAKREVRFRDNRTVRDAVAAAVRSAIFAAPEAPSAPAAQTSAPASAPISPSDSAATAAAPVEVAPHAPAAKSSTDAAQTPPASPFLATFRPVREPDGTLSPAPVAIEFAIEPDSTRSRPWKWFKCLAQSASGYLLVETDAGIVTINPTAARERIAYEHLVASIGGQSASQALLIPETVQFGPLDFMRLKSALDTLCAMGFRLEEFGRDSFKIDAVPQLIGDAPAGPILATIARDLAESGAKRGGARWREELVAKSVARSFAGASQTLTAEGATQLVEELAACKMPYVCPRGKPVMIFTSTRELDRKFNRL